MDLAAFFVEAAAASACLRRRVFLAEGQPRRIAVNKKLTGSVIEPVFT
jgi:hypothetical protein